MLNHKYAVNTNGLKKRYTTKEIVDMAVDLNLDGIEWGLSGLVGLADEIKEMATLTVDAGLEVVGYINGGKLWKSDELRQWGEVVASVGGKSLRVSHPWIAYNLDESLHQKDSFNDIFSRCVDSMPALVEVSESTGVRFVVETHGGALAASPLLVRQLFNGVDPKYVGAIYDPANTLLEGGLRPRSEVEVLGDLLAYVHAKNTVYFMDDDKLANPARAAWKHKTVAPDVGIIDWVEIFFALNCGNFEGYISMEEFFTDGDDQFERLGEAMTFLKECDKNAPSRPEPPFTTFND
ncbi:MAG: sugar phosphate isomerase/epimerase [Victivallales bacterium]|nr:sugar phosphate isomerase/epimerase [Victivallales bacterium]